jgi:hypothetical protein
MGSETGELAAASIFNILICREVDQGSSTVITKKDVDFANGVRFNDRPR